MSNPWYMVIIRLSLVLGHLGEKLVLHFRAGLNDLEDAGELKRRGTFNSHTRYKVVLI